MTQERNRILSSDHSLDSGLNTGSLGHRLEDSPDQEGSGLLNQSPRGADLRNDVIFENVCLPSPLTSQRTTSHGRRKSSPSSSSSPVSRFLFDIPLCTSEKRGPNIAINDDGSKSCCCKRDGIDRMDELIVREDVKSKTGVGEDSELTSDKHGAGAVKLVASAGTLSDDVIGKNTAQAIRRERAASAGSSAAASTDISLLGGSLTTRIERNDDIAAVAAGAVPNVQCNVTSCANALGSFGQKKPSESPKNPATSTRALLVTDLDALDDDPPPRLVTSSTSSIDVPFSNGSDQQVVYGKTDVLWELKGQRLSNFCQDLITECNKFTGKKTRRSSTGSDTMPGSCIDNEAPSFVEQRGDHGFRNIKNNQISFSRRLQNGGQCTVSGIRSLQDRRHLASENSLPDSTNKSIGTSRFISGRKTQSRVASDPQVSNIGLHFTPAHVSVGIHGSQPTAVTCNSTTAGQFRVNKEVKTKENGVRESGADAESERERESRERNVIADALRDAKTEEKQETDQPDGSRGRRGRTLARGSYDSSLLKDFIKPEFKKFSIAPSNDFDLDSELAIWEPSDFCPDRHKSAPPADLSLKETKSEDILLRTRQTSVSPLRQRKQPGERSSPRWIRGTKSVELLSSRNTSPSGSKIRRRTLSKEWQIITLTTTEDITTMIKPKATSDCQIAYPTENPEAESRFRSHSQGDTTTWDSGLPKSAPTSETDVKNIIPNSDISGTQHGRPWTEGTDPNEIASDNTTLCNGNASLAGGKPLNDPGTDDGNKAEIWDAISEALSDMTKAMLLAEEKNPSGTENVPQDHDGSCVRAEDIPQTTAMEYDSLGKLHIEEGKEGNNEVLEVSEEFEQDSVSMEMDELVKALLDFARAGDETEQKKINGQFIAENRLPTTTSAKTVAEHATNDNKTVKNENPSTTEFNKERAKTDGYFEDLLSQEDDVDSALEIKEETDFNTGDQVPLQSSMASSSPGQNITKEEEYLADSSSGNSSSTSNADSNLRQRLDSSKQVVSRHDDTTEAAASQRRRSDSNEVFPEKAFFESLFSSLGTIIFLLLAAFIFHVFTRIVEHEL